MKRFEVPNKDDKELDNKMELFLYIKCQQEMSNESERNIFEFLREFYSPEIKVEFTRLFVLNEDEQSEVMI